MSHKILNAIGIMTGTSLDGVDVALLKTDGEQQLEYLDTAFTSFPDDLKQKLYLLLEGDFTITQYCHIEKEYTEFCYNAVKPILEAQDVDLIGFHGQTLYHSPSDYITHQMGNIKYLAKLSDKKVIGDFRTDDIIAGGQGAPLVPIFHKAIVRAKAPIAVLNIGGVSNITYIENDTVIAFDIGPGSAPLNDVMRKHYQLEYDKDGEFAAKGEVNNAALAMLLDNDFFAKSYPKSLDRNHFDYKILESLEPVDQLETICEFISKSFAHALELLPNIPKAVYLAGGGRNNAHLVSKLGGAANIRLIDELGIDGDMVEAYAFAYLAVRKEYGLYSGTDCTQF